MILTEMARVIAFVIKTSWLNQVTTKSNFARENANAIAAAASEGFLTTRVGEDHYTRYWLPTPVGLEFLSEIDTTVEF